MISLLSAEVASFSAFERVILAGNSTHRLNASDSDYYITISSNQALFFNDSLYNLSHGDFYPVRNDIEIRAENDSVIYIWNVTKKLCLQPYYTYADHKINLSIPVTNGTCIFFQEDAIFSVIQLLNNEFNCSLDMYTHDNKIQALQENVSTFKTMNPLFLYINSCTELNSTIDLHVQVYRKGFSMHKCRFMNMNEPNTELFTYKCMSNIESLRIVMKFIIIAISVYAIFIILFIIFSRLLKFNVTGFNLHSQH